LRSKKTTGPGQQLLRIERFKVESPESLSLEVRVNQHGYSQQNGGKRFGIRR